MKKFNKVLSIVLTILLAALGIYVFISFIVNKDGTLYWINYIVDLLNRPLPIIGITTFAVLVFIWRVVVALKVGNKTIENIKAEYRRKQEELETDKEELEKEKEENKQEIEEMRKCIVYLCALIPNKKVNELGEKFEKGLEYGKETTNAETETN